VADVISYNGRLMKLLELNKNEIARGIETLVELRIETSHKNKKYMVNR